MANRLFNLPETKGAFQVKGKINGVKKGDFYTVKKTKTNKDFRAVNFGCMYEDKKSVFLNLSESPKPNVYFSKKDDQTGKKDTKPIAWDKRDDFSEEGYRLIGVNVGLTKTTNAEGKEVNDKKTMVPFDACDYIKDNMKDGMSVFIRGNIDFSSFIGKEGGIRRFIKYVPNQISLCKEVDFEEYDEDNKPVHDFTQTIMFMEINQETANNKPTGRFVVSAKIVTYSDIVDTEFIITDAKLANLFKKNLKPYTSISVHGHIEVSHKVEETTEDDGWGSANTMASANAPSKTEMIITGATPSTIDRETYSEKNVSEAVAKIRNAKKAESNFGSKPNINVTVDDEWATDDEDDEDSPW